MKKREIEYTFFLKSYTKSSTSQKAKTKLVLPEVAEYSEVHPKDGRFGPKFSDPRAHLMRGDSIPPQALFGHPTRPSRPFLEGTSL